MKRETSFRTLSSCVSRFAFRVSCFLLLFSSIPLTTRAQFDPDIPPATAPTSQPRTLQLVKPVIEAQQHQITLPVNFWNEHMTGWIETALSGLPSDFSHETIIAATVTRSTMVEALHQAGFVDADAWVANVKDFPRIRGDKALILLAVGRPDHIDTYLIDELITWGGWNTSIGPYGWMFKGKPGEHAAPGTMPGSSGQESSATSPADAAAPAAPTEKPSVAVQVLRDDPQIALQFRGLQHASQSFIDHPTCYDQGIYPLPRFYRNMKVLPAAVFDSNGDVPVKMIIRKVTEEEFLAAAAKYWHDPAAAAHIQAQVPIAREIDTAKAELWKLIPELRTQIKQSQEHPETVVLADSPVASRCGVLAAAIEKGYAALDFAWATWAADHCQPDPDAQTDPDTNRNLKDQAALLRQHAENLRDRAADLYEFQAANATKLKVRLSGATDAAAKAQLRQLAGRAVEYKSRAQQAENAQVLAYWKGELAQLDPKDPREDWVREIRAQTALAEARTTAAQAGIAFGQALQAESAPNLQAAESTYQNGLMQVTIASLHAQLAGVEFEIRKREGDSADPELAGYQKRRDELKQQLTAAEAATQPGTNPPGR